MLERTKSNEQLSPTPPFRRLRSLTLAHSSRSSSFANICSIFLIVHWVSSRLASILAQSDSRVKAMSYQVVHICVKIDIIFIGITAMVMTMPCAFVIAGQENRAHVR